MFVSTSHACRKCLLLQLAEIRETPQKGTKIVFDVIYIYIYI